MLNLYFSLGIPCFLLLLYGIFLILHTYKKIPYTGFILVIISGFSAVFSLQIIDRMMDFLSDHSLLMFSTNFGYSTTFLYVSLTVSILLFIYSIFLVYKEWHHD